MFVSVQNIFEKMWTFKNHILSFLSCSHRPWFINRDPWLLSTICKSDKWFITASRASVGISFDFIFTAGSTRALSPSFVLFFLYKLRGGSSRFRWDPKNRYHMRWCLQHPRIIYTYLVWRLDLDDAWSFGKCWMIIIFIST